MSTETLFYVICGAAAAVMGVYHIRSRRRLRSVLSGSLTGLAALILVNRFGGAVGAELPLNTFNLCGSAVLGVPFVAAMIIVKYL